MRKQNTLILEGYFAYFEVEAGTLVTDKPCNATWKSQVCFFYKKLLLIKFSRQKKTVRIYVTVMDTTYATKRSWPMKKFNEVQWYPYKAPQRSATHRPMWSVLYKVRIQDNHFLFFNILNEFFSSKFVICS